MTNLLTPGEEHKSKINSDNSDILEELRQIELKEKLKNKNQKKVEKVEEVKTPIIQQIKEDIDGFIYVPSINLYVAKERSLYNENFYDTQKALHSNNQKMLNLPEFMEFLKYTKENYKNIYKEITEKINPGRSEWLDADFKFENKERYVQYHIFENNKIKLIKEKLDKTTLMTDRTPGISLEDYLNENYTSQGLPNTKVKSGDLSYWYPRSDNNSVARFGAGSNVVYFDCLRYPDNRSSNLGVRVCTLNPKEKK